MSAFEPARQGERVRWPKMVAWSDLTQESHTEELTRTEVTTVETVSRVRDTAD